MIQSGGGERRRAQAQAVAVRALARGNVMPVVAVDLHLDVPGGVLSAPCRLRVVRRGWVQLMFYVVDPHERYWPLASSDR